MPPRPPPRRERPSDDDAGSDLDEEPVRRRRKGRRRKKGRATQSWSQAFGIGLAVVGVYTLVVLGLSLIHSAAGVLLILAGMGLASAGGVWFLAVAFMEDTTEGLLCFFVPFYALYYAATRFDTVWPTFAVQVVGVGMQLLGILIIAWRGIVAGM